MKSKLIVAGLALALGAGFALDAVAANPKILVHQREAAMILMAKYLGPLGGMAKGKVHYDPKIVERNAGYLEVLSKMPWDGFKASTKGTKSRARPTVWEKPSEFKSHQHKLRAEIGKLVSMSNGGNEAAVKKQVIAVARACGGCHKEFRTKH